MPIPSRCDRRSVNPALGMGGVAQRRDIDWRLVVGIVPLRSLIFLDVIWLRAFGDSRIPISVHNLLA